jgi:hypothetical protein
MSRPIQELLAVWEEAEARLYPVAMTQPEVYARALTLVHEIVAELASYTDVEGLAEAFEDAAGISVRAIERSGVSTHAVDVGLAASAAFALRYRAILVSSARREALDRIREAGEHGPAWVTVAESGDVTMGPYVRLEMHLPDGHAVQASIDIDAESGERRFRVEPVSLVPSTGERLGGASTVVPQTFLDVEGWEATIAGLRAAIEGSSG